MESKNSQIVTNLENLIVKVTEYLNKIIIKTLLNKILFFFFWMVRHIYEKSQFNLTQNSYFRNSTILSKIAISLPK